MLPVLGSTRRCHSRRMAWASPVAVVPAIAVLLLSLQMLKPNLRRPALMGSLVQTCDDCLQMPSAVTCSPH